MQYIYNKLPKDDVKSSDYNLFVFGGKKCPLEIFSVSTRDSESIITLRFIDSLTNTHYMNSSTQITKRIA